MTQPFSENRRLVLRLATSTAVLAAASAVWVRPAQSTVRDPNLAMRLVAFLPHAGSAARLGGRYLALAPAEGDQEWLLSAILAGEGKPAKTYAAAPDNELHRVVCECRQRDFTKGHTVSVDGWILSRTEARLCALVALRSA